MSARPNTTPDLVMTILSTDDHSMLFLHFKSYGEIINYCMKHGIVLTRHQRSTMIAYQWPGEGIRSRM